MIIIIIDGLYNVVDVRNALSEHLNMITSTNTMRHALHEANIGSSKKQKKSLLMTKNVLADWNLLNVVKIGLSMIGRG